MNQAYKLVWNTLSNSWIVASELAKGAKKSSAKTLTLAVLLAGGLTPGIAAATPAASALPTGESVAAGTATFDRTVSNQLTINQSTGKLITNWNSFDVGSSAKVIFAQPDAASIALNRISSGSATEIFGQVTANGQLVLVNPNGITFGAGSQINAASLIGSVLDISDSNFNNGNLLFERGTSTGTIDNKGSLTATAGAVSLMAPTVKNSGNITATGSNASLINADAVDVTAVDPSITTASSISGLIQHSGSITATQVSSVGGKILLKGDTSQAASQIQLAGSLQAGQTLVNGRSILVNGVLNLNGSANSLDLTSTDGYRLSSTSVLNLSGASSGFSVNGTAYTVIRDVNQLQSMGFSGRYVLGNDIDATATSSWNSGAGFSPLSFANGIVDGLGHAVNGLFISRPSTDNVGLFGLAQNVSLQNISLTNASITGRLRVGGLAGQLQNSSGGVVRVSNSAVSGQVSANDNLAGGLLGYIVTVGGQTYIQDSHATATVTADSNAGGLIGANQVNSGAATISNSYATGNVTATVAANSGGLLGANTVTTGTGTVSSSYATGNVSGVGAVGGLVGYLYANTGTSSISNSYATGAVSTTSNSVGGLVGYMLVEAQAGTASIANSYATGGVSGNYNSAGGLLGNSINQNGTSSISNTYASGLVAAGPGARGGLVGRMSTFGATAISTFSNSYWDEDTTQQPSMIGSNSGGVVTSLWKVSGNGGANPSAYAQASYSNLDFNNSWFMAEGYSRPMLRAFLNTPDADGKIAISNLYQLQGMAANLAGSYYLAQDIDASSTASSVAAGNLGNRADVWGGRGFAPVGNSVNYFSGTLDGNSHVIDSLNINRSATNYVGLFGNALNSNMQNIGLTNADIRGYQYVGALLGQGVASGQAVVIRNSFSQGSVSGQNSVGGLIGQLYSSNGSILIQDVQTSGQIATVSYSGGVVGNITALNGVASIQLDRSFSNASLSGSLGRGALVGLVATEDGGNAGISNSYWDYQASGLGSAVGLSAFATLTNVSSLTTLLSKNLSSYASWGSNIDAQGGTGSTWRIYEGQTAPLLRSFLKQVNVNIGNASKTYDGTAYSGGNGYSLSNPAASLLGSISYAGTAHGARNAGTYSLSGSGLYSDQLGYDISYVDGSLSILKASLGITAVDVNKTYDGTTSASGALLVSSGSLFGGDTISGGSFAFDNKHAGTGKTVAVSGVMVNDGNGGNNYDVSYVDNTNSSIGKASLLLRPADVVKTYDGTTDASTSAQVIAGTLFSGDSISGGLFGFSNKNAGNGKTVSIYTVDIDDGNGGNNYQLSFADNMNSVINKKRLTISAVADSKVYDARLWSDEKPVVTGRVRGDSIAGLTQSFSDKNVGIGKTIHVDAGYVIRDGNNGANYDVVLIDNHTGVITPKTLTISTVANSKVYDGGVTSVSKPVVSGLAYGDRVTGLFQQYQTKTVGENKQLLIKSGYVVQDGNAGNNYTVTEQTSTDGVISAH